jgi:quercetin dioxygenase-like cupin family protein
MASRRAFIWPLTGALLGVALLVVSAERGMTRDSVLSLLGTTQTIFGQPIAYPTEAPAKVAASIVTMQPGEETGWHRHDVPMFCYILEGEVTVDYGTKGTRVYKRGTHSWRPSTGSTTDAIPDWALYASSPCSWVPRACPTPRCCLSLRLNENRATSG